MEIAAEAPLYSFRATGKGFKFDPRRASTTIAQLVETYGIKPVRIGRTYAGLTRDDVRVLEEALKLKFDEALAVPGPAAVA